MPAGVLVFIALGAMAVDLSHVHLAQRELIAAVQAAAGDAAGASYHEGTYYQRGEVVIDARAARAEAEASLAGRDPAVRITAFTVTAGGEVVIRAAASVETIFAKALPGGPSAITVTATARARLAP